MFVNGPRVVRKVTGEDVTPEELGGPDIHMTISGVAHLLGRDEYEAMDKVKKLISFLPTSCRECPPHSRQEVNSRRIKELETYSDLVAKGESFDVHGIIGHLLDNDSFLEIQDAYAQNIVVGFGRMDGMVVGIVANNRMYHEGRLDSKAGVKAARFISFCNAFNIPILTIVDTLGFLLGVEEEHRGMIRHVAKLLYAYANARVPMVSLIIGNAYGGGYIAVGSKNLGNRYVISWPTSSLGVMRAEEAYEVLYGKHRDKYGPIHRQMFVDEYREEIEKPEAGYKKGYIDEIIDPSLSRYRISLAFKKLIDGYSCKCKGYGIFPT
jgi:acetyl-CoA carboxylase carboxyltransferase component